VQPEYLTELQEIEDHQCRDTAKIALRTLSHLAVKRFKGEIPMTIATCEVAGTINELAKIVASGKLTVPRCQRRAEELLELLEDVSCGRGGPDHYQAMQGACR